MSLEFLEVDAVVRDGRFAPVARSPLQRLARAAGARLQERDGWMVAVSYPPAEREARVVADAVGWADVSHLGKVELQGPPSALAELIAQAADRPPPEPGRALRAQSAWWCPLTRTRALIICEPAALRELRRRLERSAAGRSAAVADLTSAFAALTIVGPLARELFARFCAIDLRPRVTPVGAVRPGSIARQPGIIVREAEDRYLMLFGSALAEYMWSQVQEAARALGGGPVGVDALAQLAEQPGELRRPAREVQARA